MKLLKTLLALAIVLMIVIVMAQTVPSKDRHKEAMMKAVTESVESESEERGIADNVLTRLGKNVVVKAVETALNSKLKMHDYYVLNTTYVVLKGEEQMLSLGVLGMVFTFDKDMLHEKLQEALKGNSEEAVTEKEAAKQSAKELKKLEREKAEAGAPAGEGAAQTGTRRAEGAETPGEGSPQGAEKAGEGSPEEQLGASYHRAGRQFIVENVKEK